MRYLGVPPFLCAAALVAWGGLCAGQANPGEPASPHFSADTTLVLIPTTVTDPLNRYVLGLEKQDFQLSEDGTPQIIANLSGEDVPLSVALVFDTSSSMADKLRVSRQAVAQFLKTMNAQDEACLIEFGDQAELASEFTGRVEDLQTKLDRAQAHGLTALFDGAEMALREMKKARNPRKAILIISDGGDNNSRYKASEIQALVREADVQVYAMGVFEPSIFMGLTKEEVSGPRLLSELAEQTGGRAFSASDPSDLPSVAARIGIELRNQYVLAYSPKNQNKDGKYRKIELTVARPAGIADLKVRWRLGYYAPVQ